jgi:hypothetical protein
MAPSVVNNLPYNLIFLAGSDLVNNPQGWSIICYLSWPNITIINRLLISSLSFNIIGFVYYFISLIVEKKFGAKPLTHRLLQVIEVLLFTVNFSLMVATCIVFKVDPVQWKNQSCILI